MTLESNEPWPVRTPSCEDFDDTHKWVEWVNPTGESHPTDPEHVCEKCGYVVGLVGGPFQGTLLPTLSLQSAK